MKKMKTLLFALLSLAGANCLSAQAIASLTATCITATTFPDPAGCAISPMVDGSTCIASPPSCRKELGNYTLGQTYACQLKARDVPNTDVVGATYTLVTVTASPSDITITIVPDGTITITEGANPGTGDIDFTAQAAIGGSCTFIQRFKILVQRAPVDIALVLDKSGSMFSLSGASAVTRWNALIGAVGLFMTNLEAFDQDGDQIGLTFFSGAAVQPPSGFGTSLITTVGSTSAVNGNFSGGSKVTPGGGTAFGAGLADGFGKLPSATNRNRIIIAFTDGEQNIPTTSFVNVSAGKVNLGGTALNTTADPIRIYPIGIGAAGSLPAILNDITQSTEGSGMLQISTETGTALSGNYGTNFLNVLADVLRSGSPQIVDVRRGNFDIPFAPSPSHIAGFDRIESFVVNKGAAKVVFNVLSDGPKEFSIISVLKDGTELIQFGKLDNGPGFRTFSIDLRAPGLPAITPEGTWTIRTRTQQQHPCEVVLLVDDHNVKYKCSTGNSRLAVGKPIDAKVNLAYRGTAIKGVTVEAIILKPGDDLGHLLATTQHSFDRPSTDDASNPGIQKYLDLLKDSTFLNKLKASGQVIPLSYNAADSSYNGQYANTDVSGVYQIIFRIKKLNDPNFGQLERYQGNSVYVYFPAVDMENSAVTIDKSGTVLTFRPIGTNGKYIGPGWDNTIVLDAKNAKIQNIVDNGDGSYSISITGSLDGKGKLSIGGETIFDGDLAGLSCYGPNASFLQKMKCWLMGLGLPGWFIWVILAILALIIGWLVKKKKK